MGNVITKFFNRQYNKFKKRYLRKAITENSKGQYEIVADAIDHEDNYIVGDLLTSEIMIRIPDREYEAAEERGEDMTQFEDKSYFIVLTSTTVIVSNHVFPNLGPVDEVVAERLYNKAKLKLSSIRQAYKREQLQNESDLIAKVSQNLKESRKKAREKLNPNKDK